MVGRRWIETTIGALVGCKQVSIQTGPFGTVLSASEYVDYGIPVISVREIRQGRIEIYDETPAVSDSTYRRLSQFALKPYDLVFARKGSIDRSALIAEDAQKMFLGSDGIRLRFNNPTLAQIVFHCVRSPQTRQFLTVSAYGTTMAGLNETIISSIPICIPEDAMEQQHIAKALSDMDDMIASLEKLIAKKKAIMQGTMQELLTGKRRLPGFSEEWEEKAIHSFGRFISGNTFPLTFQGNQNGKYPFYKVSDFNNQGNERFLKKANNYISIETAEKLNCNIIPTESIIFAKIGAAIFLERKKMTTTDCCIDNNTMSFQSYSNASAHLLWYMFQRIRFSELVEATALPSLSGKAIGSIILRFPPTLGEQTAIADILLEMDAEINALEKKLSKARQIKRGMMQQLLTGRIRLM